MHLQGSEGQKEALKHEAGEGDEVQASERLGQAITAAPEATIFHVSSSEPWGA
jgi:hypothetical protein